MKSIVRRILPSECPNCGKPTVLLYDKFNNSINYPLLCKYNSFDQIYKKLEKRDLKYMRCESCKCVFVLDWTKKIIPYPINKDKYKEFERVEE